MGAFDFPRSHRLIRPSDFKTVYERGRKRHSRGFVFFAMENRLAHPRLGLSVSRKIGGAVTRNRLKRIVREACRQNWHAWGLAGLDVVVVAKRGAAGMEFGDVCREFSTQGRRP